VRFAPPGGIVNFPSLRVSPDKLKFRVVGPAEAAHPTKERTSPIADLYWHNGIGIETATTNLGRLPLLLAICAFDPEAWCAVVIHSGALEVAGLFRDVASPLREWLLRSVIAGHPIGMQHARWPGPSLEATRDTKMSTSAPKSALGLILDRCELTESSLPDLVPAANSERPTWLVEYLDAAVGRRLGVP